MSIEPVKQKALEHIASLGLVVKVVLYQSNVNVSFSARLHKGQAGFMLDSGSFSLTLFAEDVCILHMDEEHIEIHLPVWTNEEESE